MINCSSHLKRANSFRIEDSMISSHDVISSHRVSNRILLLSRRNSTDTLYEVSRALQSASIVDIHRTGYILRR